MSGIVCVVLAFCFYSVLSQPLLSSTLTGVSRLAVSEDRVFVIITDSVYRLSSTLQQQGDPITGGTVITSTSDGQWVIVCTDTVSCTVYNGSSLTVNGTVTNTGTADSLVIFSTAQGDSLYTGSYTNDDAIWYRQYGFAGSNTQNRTTEHNAEGTYRTNGGRTFVGGFYAGGYAYYVVADATSSSNGLVRIIRVCNDSAAGGNFNNQYELILRCDGTNSYFGISVFGLSVINEETLLLGVRSQGASADICSYSISDINSRMDAAYQSCVVDGNGNINVVWQSSTMSCSSVSGSICSLSVPAIGVSSALASSNLFSNSTLLNGITSIIGVSIDDINFIYLSFTASSKHYINKYLWTNNSDISLISEVEVSSSVTDLQWSVGSEYVYGINGGTVIGIKTEDCSSATSCTECISQSNPLCGWCVVEAKCSRRPFCQDSNEMGRYLTTGGNSDSCINSVSINPSSYVIDIQSVPHEINVTFQPAPPPTQLSGEGYFCVFNNIMTPLQLISGSNVGVCSVGPVISTLNTIQLATNFSVISNRTGINFITSPTQYMFYNCPVAMRCSECVDNVLSMCGWCQLDFTCTGQNSSCTNGIWLTAKDESGMDRTSLDICPFLQPNGDTTDGRYTQPVDVPKSLQLITNNTESIPGLSYQCMYGTVNRSATANSDYMVTCDITSSNQLTLGPGISGGTQTQSFSLLQVYNGRTYTIETATNNNINVILYDCPTLANGCSSCIAQNIGSGFECSWCNSVSRCIEESTCSSGTPVTVSGSCPLPVISDFNPKTGPPQGKTVINITGTDLGTQESDIISIIIGGSRGCSIIFYQSGERIMCTVNTSGIDTNGPIAITVRRSNGNVEVTSSEQYQFLTPSIQLVSPTQGPASGGTKVRVNGTNLNIGNTERTSIIMREVVSMSGRRKRTAALCPDINCTITGISSNVITCTTVASYNCTRSVLISVDDTEFPNSLIEYIYHTDPTFTRLRPQMTIPSGGIPLTFTGDNLNIIQLPTITINVGSSSTEACVSNGSSVLICTASSISSVTSSDYGNIIRYTLSLDGAPSPDYMNSQLSLTLQRDPSFTGISETTRTISSGDDITITGINIESVELSQINITVGDEVCNIRTRSNTEVDCTPPEKSVGTSLFLRVRVGTNLVFPNTSMDAPEWTVTYIETATTSDSGNLPVIAGGSAGGVIALVVIILIILAIPLCCFLRRQSKKQDLRVTTLLSQMETMELEMADQCKQAFAELQTDLGELVAENSLDMQQLPFHDFPTYATKVFFPSAHVNHPVLSPPKAPAGMNNESLEVLLVEFRELVFDKNFLIAFIKTLEAQPKFTLQEKSTMASLLMVACLKDVSYATEVLQALLGDLIRRSLSNTKNHPKLLLRRTESVAEKLLTNWFCVALYPYMLEHAGAPLFVLYKAVKAQLEKGSIDVITGEARNSLSEEKLLRQSLDFKVMECEVETGNSHLLLSDTKRQNGLEPPPPASNEDVQTMKLLDTDSVSQAKEKVLDFIYGNRPVSLRPSITEVELELCRGTAGIPLKDQDTTSRRDGEWMRINTLGHFNIPEMAEAAIEDPKKPMPRFRLVARHPTASPGRPVSGIGYDVPGTIVASASVTSQTSLLASAQTIDTNTRLFHLVKPEANDGDQKIVSEVFLTRLLSTKRILQPYVDDLFHAIFTIPSGKPLPKAIKIIFDFLDCQAADLGVNDPEILHTWKTNSLPLRFWVNLIKNPDFVFDINKSATVDSCFTVIAQAYIDACSTAEVRYTKDTPSARLLYANEVKHYKSEVLNYYSSIQSLPTSSSEENKAHFNEMAHTYFENFKSKEGVHFHSDSALLEIYRYAIQYGDEIMETLNEERLTLKGAQFNNLRQKYNVNSSAM